MKAPDMKPFPGVRRVPNSSNWHYWKKNPETLWDHPKIAGQQWAFRGSLGTSDLREANARAAAKLAELEAYWATLRAGTKPTAVLDVTPAMMEAIAQRLHASLLADDEALRRDPLALAKSLTNWWQAHEMARKAAHERANRAAMRAEDDTPFRPGQMPRWLSDEAQGEIQAYVKAGHAGVPLGGLLELLQERHQAVAKEARQALARGNMGPFLLRAHAEAMELGVNLGPDSWLSNEAQTLRDTCQKAYLKALDDLAQRDSGEVVDTPVKLKKEAVKGSKRASGASEGEGAELTLGKVVEEVLKQYPVNGFTRKIKAATSLLVLALGAKTPVQDIRQAQITAFMNKLCCLPVDWYTRSQKGESIAKMLDQDHPKCISPSTFESTYKAAISSFLDRASHEFQDQGFPPALSVRFAKYQGSREENEEQQRNFKPTELARLFHSKEFAELAKAPGMAHRYWLPLVMLYTGARPREICQINPQVDTGEEGGVPFLLISQDTTADEGIVKSVKTSEERYVPIHPELVRLGFLEYIKKVKGQGAKRLFPGFGYHKGNAAARAGGWFSDFLEELGIRDETPKAQLTGLYAFRKTFITEAHRKGLRFMSITGHADDSTSKVVRDSYIMEQIPLLDKAAVVNQVVFEVNPPVWGE